MMTMTFKRQPRALGFLCETRKAGKTIIGLRVRQRISAVIPAENGSSTWIHFNNQNEDIVEVDSLHMEHSPRWTRISSFLSSAAYQLCTLLHRIPKPHMMEEHTLHWKINHSTALRHDQEKHHVQQKVANDRQNMPTGTQSLTVLAGTELSNSNFRRCQAQIAVFAGNPSQK